MTNIANKLLGHKNQGKIKFYNPEKAYGFISTERSGDIFFHLNNVLDSNIEHIEPGQDVSFLLAKGKQEKYEAFEVSFKLEVAAISAVDIIGKIMYRNESSYNTTLLNHLMNGIAEINDEQSYSLAKELLKYNEIAGLDKTFKEHCFLIASDEYRMRFWLNNEIDYCDLGYLSKSLESGSSSYLETIDKRLSDYQLQKDKPLHKVVFQNIQFEILKEIGNAKKSIRIAIAWFTHQKLFNALLEKLSRNVSIELVIINDHINNWSFGLPFEKFITAGGKLYLTGQESIMHHKFCIIDSNVLLNGSYNWTYYAEERNQENCMFFYKHEDFIDQFNAEFINLIADLEPISGQLPPAFVSDVFSRKIYQSIDLICQAESKPLNQRKKAVALLHEALLLNPENSKGKKLLESWSPRDEETMKEIAVEQTANVIRKQIDCLNNLDVARPISEQIIDTSNSVNNNTVAIVNNRQIVSDLQARLAVAENLKEQVLKGKRGKLRINLKWDTLDDLDLHILLPDLQEISYNTKKVICQGFEGELDIDANAGNHRTKTPQENIFWEAGFPLGTFRVFVVHYSQNEKQRVPFAITIMSEYEEALVLTGIIEYSNVSKTELHVAELNNSEENGFSITSLLSEISLDPLL